MLSECSVCSFWKWIYKWGLYPCNANKWSSEFLVIEVWWYFIPNPRDWRTNVSWGNFRKDCTHPTSALLFILTWYIILYDCVIWSYSDAFFSIFISCLNFTIRFLQELRVEKENVERYQLFLRTTNKLPYLVQRMKLMMTRTTSMNPQVVHI